MQKILELSPSAESKVRVISDLHYGHARCEAPSPAELLDELGETDILIIAGDLAETRPCAQQDIGNQYREKMRAACRERSIELIELAGNHDTDAPYTLLSLWGGRVIIMHGHLFYPELAPWSWEYLNNKPKCKALIAQYPDWETKLESRFELAARMSQLSPPILGHARASSSLWSRIMHCIWPPERPLRIIQSWMNSPTKAHQFVQNFFPQCETLIFGHLHRLGSWKRSGCTIYSTGAWFRNASPAQVFIHQDRNQYLKITQKKSKLA